MPQLRHAILTFPDLFLLFMLVLGWLKGKILQANLSQVAQLHNLPQLLLGDFNEVLSSEDKLGGRHINLNRALSFKECLDSCNLLGLGFFGPKFTWLNLRQVLDLILERIDRCFANPAWRLLFPEASVTHLPRVFSDHCLVLLELSKPPSAPQNKPFRFQTIWLEGLGKMKLTFPLPLSYLQTERTIGINRSLVTYLQGKKGCLLDLMGFKKPCRIGQISFWFSQKRV